jgi:hypothetical protein
MGRTVNYLHHGKNRTGGFAMTYCYTQISQYLACPRRYQYRYPDGWKEKDTRAAMLFGRAFEQALAACFLREDPAATLFREWSACQNPELHFSKNDTLGPNSAARHPASRALLPRRPYSHPSATPQPAGQGCQTRLDHERFRGRHRCHWIFRRDPLSAGKPLPVATPKNRPACWLSIRNWSATPG